MFNISEFTRNKRFISVVTVEEPSAGSADLLSIMTSTAQEQLALFHIKEFTWVNSHMSASIVGNVLSKALPLTCIREFSLEKDLINAVSVGKPSSALS